MKGLHMFEYPFKGLKRKLDLEQDPEDLQRQFDNAISATFVHPG